MPQTRGPLFLRPEVFEQMVAQLATSGGTPYQDVATIYGDLSRLVVAWLATTPPEELRAMYNDLGWEGGASVRPMHDAARLWLRTHHPERARRLGI